MSDAVHLRSQTKLDGMDYMRFWNLGYLLLVLCLVNGLAGCSKRQEDRRGEHPSAPVEVAEIESGTIRSLRTYSGALEAHSSFMVSPKIGGRLEAMLVDIGDPVERGAVVARLDDAEYQQGLAQAEADLLVARANLGEAISALEIARRAMERTQTLSIPHLKWPVPRL